MISLSKRKLKPSDLSKVGKKSNNKESNGEDNFDKNLISLSNVLACKNEFKNASNKKDWNFKIVSWNINGLRAWIKKGGINYIEAEDADIFCLQETKYDPSANFDQLSKLSSYHCYWLPSVRKGYAGVGIVSKIKPLRVEYGISEEKFDQEDVPNAGAKLIRLEYKLKWCEALRKYMAHLDTIKPIIWTGDLNVAHNRIDLKYPSSHLHSACFTMEERNNFTQILSDGYFDSFRIFQTLEEIPIVRIQTK